MRELEENTANAWLKSGAIRITDVGEENTYYVNEFDHEFYCKNYPTCGYPIPHIIALLLADWSVETADRL
jgi:hypothetical protein